MLKSLRVRQLVIIDDLTLEFGPGMTLLTGETGAGKSILVDALGLVAGDRADRSLVRAGADRAVIEALFDVAGHDAVRDWAADRGLDDPTGEGELLIRREVPAEGSGRVLVNGSPCTLGLLRELGGVLVELHGQHEQQSLLSTERQTAILDRWGGHDGRVEGVAAACAAVLAARRRLDGIRSSAAGAAARREAIARDLREIEGVAPKPGELEEIDRDRNVLRNAARMGELLDQVVAATYEADDAAASVAARCARQARELARLDPALDEPAARLETAAVELQEAGAAFREYRDHGDFDPARLDGLETRRAAIERLLLRYGADEAEVLARGDALRAELDGLADLDGAIAAATRELGAAETAYRRAAGALTRARKAAARRLAPEVERQLAELALGAARFRVELTPVRGETIGGNGDALALGSRGAERAEFMLAANPGEPFRPLARVASGGELSRVMLALHAIAEDAAERRVLIFDEVDAGVGGAVADAVGSRLAALARRHQVLCVTHLPQVAAHADGHYRVTKQVDGERTRALVERLDHDHRVDELARMLGGRRPTETSRRHASELLGAAARRGPRPAPRRRA